jgi:hypothetical protein
MTVGCFEEGVRREATEEERGAAENVLKGFNFLARSAI